MNGHLGGCFEEAIMRPSFTWVFKLLCICLQQERKRRIHSSFWTYFVLINSPLPTLLPGLLHARVPHLCGPTRHRPAPTKFSWWHGLTELPALTSPRHGLPSHPDRERLEGRALSHSPQYPRDLEIAQNQDVSGKRILPYFQVSRSQRLDAEMLGITVYENSSIMCLKREI